MSNTYSNTNQTKNNTAHLNHNEIQQLKVIISALRDNLEFARIEKANEIEKALNASKAEIAQLHGTIYALREQIEAGSAKS